MAVGNGDERQTAAWERVEAKLDRMGTKLDNVEQMLAATAARVHNTEDNLLRLSAKIDLVDRKLEATRQSLEARIELAKVELLDAMNDMARMEASAARTSMQGHIDQLAGDVDALRQQVEDLQRRLESAR